MSSSALALAVDPAVAERDVERLGRVHGRDPGALLGHLDPEAVAARVVRVHPRRELVLGGERENRQISHSARDRRLDRRCPSAHSRPCWPRWRSWPPRPPPRTRRIRRRTPRRDVQAIYQDYRNDGKIEPCDHEVEDLQDGAGHDRAGVRPGLPGLPGRARGGHQRPRQLRRRRRGADRDRDAGRRPRRARRTPARSRPPTTAGRPRHRARSRRRTAHCRPRTEPRRRRPAPRPRRLPPPPRRRPRPRPRPPARRR